MTRFDPFALALTLTLISTPALAQSIDGEVVRNPDDTVTYTIDIDGPPRGLSAMLVSPLFLPAPIQIPGFFQPLWLNPIFLLSPGGVSHDAAGQAPAFDWTIPPAAVNGQSIFFQSLSVDEFGNFAFGQNFMCVDLDIVVAAPESMATTYNQGSNTHVQVWGQPGQQYTVKIRDRHGNLVHDRNVTVGPEGHTGAEEFGTSDLEPGATYEIWRHEGGGGQTMRWSGSFGSSE